MISTRGKFIKIVSIIVSMAMFSMATPAVIWKSLGVGLTSLVPEPVIYAETRELKQDELDSMRGRDNGADANPYIAGQSKLGVNYHGVDLLTGNFSFSETDLSFEGGYGIPVAITRTYSANNPDEGPFGRGWTLSVDLRTTAGGLLKGGGSPSRTVPVRVSEKALTTQQPGSPHWLPTPQGQPDPSEPTEGVVSEDASGLQSVIQRDVDGVLSPPAWDKNKVDAVYVKRIVDGEPITFTDNVTVTTPEGTVYYYDEFGYVPHPNVSGAPGKSSVMKISTVTDRHGNTTTYTYGSTHIQFYRWSGTVYELPLMSIDMPGGRGFDFTWANGRITEVTDGTRVVEYGYASGSDQVTSVTTPGSYVTTYGYGDPEGSQSGPLLRHITDPRGMTTDVYYKETGCYTPPLDENDIPQGQGAPVIDGVFCYKIEYPNDTTLYLRNWLGEGASIQTDFPFVFPVNGRNRTGAALITDGASWGEAINELYVQGGGSYGVGIFASGPFYGPLQISAAQYDEDTQNLLESTSWTYGYGDTGDLNIDRRFSTTIFNNETGLPTLNWNTVITTTSYNYFGAPLQKSVEAERSLYNVQGTTETTQTTYYAYWGADKYFQQKAVMDPAGNVSFTDYFDSSSSAGKGQVSAVYDEKHANFSAWETIEEWREGVEPTSSTAWSATFTYDEEGRPLTVTKLGPGSTTVVTKTEYSGAQGTFGNATKVIEDFGGINRTTETLEFNAFGKVTEVKDAANRVIETEYDDAGNIESVTRTSGTPKVLASYTYGSTPGTYNFGMLLSAIDGVSGTTQVVSYWGSGEGGRTGQVKKTEGWDDIGVTGMTPTYTVEYDYNDSGDRKQTTYTTANGVRKYYYDDYLTVSGPGDKRVFQTMTAETNGGQGVQGEQFHYSYDTAGRLTHAAFMQTPQSQETYTANYPAAARAQTYYLYSPIGQIDEIYNFFQNYVTTYTGGHYTITPTITNVTGQKYFYDEDTGLREKTEWYEPDTNGAWQKQRDETYDYDELGQLVEADYNGSISGQNFTWMYDGAGNRNLSGYAYDKLNRMTASPGSTTYQNDILGNRTWKNYGQSSVQRYVWDEMGRLSSLCGTTQGAKYHYRVDGLRIKKVEGLTIAWVDDQSSESEEEASGYYDEHWAVNKPTTRYFYDGQMSFEDDYTIAGGEGTETTVTRYALGARGIDGIETTTVQGASAVYPVYDGHGNMIATLARNGTSFARANNREYGVWGDIRSGSGGDQGYVANLGHRKDAESGLTYMRARYYEPGTGRFISEDIARDGKNWFVYCSNDPVQQVDPTGELPLPPGTLQYLLTKFLANAALGREAWMMGHAAVIMWLAWLQLDRDGIAQLLGRDQKVTWVAEAEAGLLGTSPLLLTDVKTKAQALMDMYSTCLQISMWIFDDLWFRN